MFITTNQLHLKPYTAVLKVKKEIIRLEFRVDDPDDVVNKNIPDTKETMRLIKKQSRLAKLTSFMLLSLIFCFLPTFVLHVFWTIERVLGLEERTDLRDTFRSVCYLIAGFKCIINPLLYYHSIKDFRSVINNIAKSA